ncbi:hypothetical protein ABMA46_10230 [Mesorhizobium sp. CN5-321]|uniref:hypothetical protein n=1 Tax=Mesorhizobium hunchu TaxID=3157708 RepID=UPI0032B70F8A
MIAWPSTLPQTFMSDGYQSGEGDGRIRSTTDSGIAKLRRRFSAVARPLSGSMFMTDMQLAAFRTFFEETTGGGSLPFTFPAQDEAGTWTVQFGQNVPSWGRMALGWSVKLELVVLP